MARSRSSRLATNWAGFDMPININTNVSVRYCATDDMTIAVYAQQGTGTIGVTKALAATPTSYTAATFPVTLAAGDWITVAFTNVSGLFTAQLKRTA